MTGVATKPTATTVATATAIFLRLNMKILLNKKFEKPPGTSRSQSFED
jgi:hypothetical protein